MRQNADGAASVPLAAGRGRFLLVRDPEEIWRVLVSEGEAYAQGKWKRRAARLLGRTLDTLDGEERRRLLLQPALDRRRIESFEAAARQRTEDARKIWREGDRVCLRDELDRVSLAIAGDVLLSTDLGESAERLAAALGVLMESVPRLLPPLPATSRRAVVAKAAAAVDGSSRSDGARASPTATCSEGSSGPISRTRSSAAR